MPDTRHPFPKPTFRAHRTFHEYPLDPLRRRSFSKDVCSPKLVDVRSLLNETSRNKNCTYTNYKQAGGTVSFHYACNDKQQLDGDGSFTMDASGVHGTIHANSSMHGQATTVDMTYQGIPTGASCDYTPPKPAQ